MPIKWGSFQSGWDKFLTPVDRLIRDWRVFVALAIVLLMVPVIKVAIWVFFIHDLMMAWLGWDPLQWLLSQQLFVSLLMMGFMLFVILHVVPACILFERKISAYIQDRHGPNRVGWWGWFQSFADGGKMFFKEDIIPANVDKPIYLLAPALATGLALIAFAPLPWAGEIAWPWNGPDGTPAVVTTQVAQLDIGILYMLAVGSLSVYAVVLAGWASNNKYSFYGGMRATSQMLSYEIPLALAALVAILMVGSLRLEDMQSIQTSTGLWLVFVHPVAFLIMLVAAFAETNRAPFDVVECEQELIGGFHTEYNSMKFGMFFLGEYAHMVINSALLVFVFLGGYEPLPFLPIFAWLGEAGQTWWAALLKLGVIWAKISLMLFLYMHVRWTLPRFRFDQIMRLAWKSLVPAGMVIVAGTALLTLFGLRIDPQAGAGSALPWMASLFPWLAALGMNVLVAVGALWLAGRSRSEVTGRQENMPTATAQ